MSNSRPARLTELLAQIRTCLHQQRQSALPLCNQALALARETHDERTELEIILLLSQLFDQSGYPQQDMDVLFEGLQLAQSHHLPAEQAILLYAIGRAYYTRAEYRRALQVWNLALESAQLARDLVNELHVRTSIASIYDALEDFSTAAQLHQQVVHELQQQALPDATLTLHANLNLTYSLYKLGDYRSAMQHCLHALKMARLLEHRDDEGEILFRQAQLHLALGEDELAEPLLLRGAELCDQSGHWWGLAHIRYTQAEQARLHGALPKALPLAEEALQLARLASSPLIELATLRLISVLAEQQGQLAQALQAEREVSRIEHHIAQNNRSNEARLQLDDLAGLRPSANSRLLQLASDPLFAGNDAAAMFAELCRQGRAILQVDRCALWLLNEAQDTLECRFESAPDKVARQFASCSSDHAEAIFGLLARRDTLIAHNTRYHQHTWQAQHEALGRDRVASLLMLPLYQGERWLGALSFEHLELQHNWLPEQVHHAGQLASIALRALAHLEQLRLQHMLNQQAQDLLRAKEHAESANAAKSRFISSLSHELRTPMHAILGFADLGLDKAEHSPREKLAHYFHNIHDSGERMLRLVNDLLDLARLEHGKLHCSFASCTLDALVRCCEQEMQVLLLPKQLELICELPAELCLLSADANRLLQVLRNLLGNAIKFSPPAGQIRLKLRREQQHWLLELTDQGPGIPPDALPHVFDAFYQADNAKLGGIGLGLAISREIVQAHRGSLDVSNRTQGGCCFTLRLPAFP